ncbi:MAG: 6-carboxyhexanoate--CoA ligase [Desulfuromonadaceae bacterium]|nr:6-carboxyhexanoate--CoA ligase [Desulfuromonadaceae bacterium]
MSVELNSLRMRAERDNRHISGAERLVSLEDLGTVAVDMLQRALQHPCGQAERIYFYVEPIKCEQLLSGCLPDFFNNQVTHWQQGRELAKEMLLAAGVSATAIAAAIRNLADGAAPGGVSMRGAMLIDSKTGERLEPDQARGVRVSRMDLSAGVRAQLRSLLAAQKLDNPHVVEALTLAAKVLAAPGVVAELCWSDDPDYTAGYVATADKRYQRISLLKPAGEERGGRAFFVQCGKQRLAVLIDWLEHQPLMIERVGRIHPVRYWREES